MKTLFLLGAFFFAFGARAETGNSVGGGGKAIVCRANDSQILSAEMFDLYEGRIRDGRPALISNLPYTEQLKNAVKKVEKFSAGALERGPNPAELDLAKIKIQYLPKGNRLEPTDDSLHAVAPSLCKIEQLAVFSIRQGKLIIDQEIFDKLDETNKAALFFHELVYRYLRRSAGESDSFYTRQIVSYYFANENITPLMADLPEKTYECIDINQDGKNNGRMSVFVYYDPKFSSGFAVQSNRLCGTNWMCGRDIFVKTIDNLVPTGFSSNYFHRLGEFLGAEPFQGDPPAGIMSKTRFEVGATGPIQPGVSLSFAIYDYYWNDGNPQWVLGVSDPESGMERGGSNVKCKLLVRK